MGFQVDVHQKNITFENIFDKFLSGKIAIFEQTKTMPSKDYASISICPFIAFKHNIEHQMFKNETVSLSEIGKLVRENAWKRNETFYFVSYPTNDDPGFECFTTKDSVDRLRPCSFPFWRNWNNKS